MTIQWNFFSFYSLFGFPCRVSFSSKWYFSRSNKRRNDNNNSDKKESRELRYKGCPKINARFEFAAIFALTCWQPWKKNSLTAESLWLVKMERYTIYNNVEWIINHEKVDAGFSSKIILSDEARFHLDGFVNRQNCVFGVRRTHVWLTKNECTHNMSLFGADFGQKASSYHTFLRTRLVKQQPLMVLDIATR